MNESSVEFVNESGLEFADISSEAVRVYHLANGDTYTIEQPLRLHVSESGGHRVFDASGWSHYVKPGEGWAIRWRVKPGKPNFVK